MAMAIGKNLVSNQFNPYTHDQLFLIAAFILEDVMVTAYQVFCPRLIQTGMTRNGRVRLQIIRTKSSMMKGIKR